MGLEMRILKLLGAMKSHEGLDIMAIVHTLKADIREVQQALIKLEKEGRVMSGLKKITNTTPKLFERRYVIAPRRRS